MAKKYTAGTKSDFYATYMRLLKRLYPLLGKGLGDLLTFQTIWGKIINIYQLYLPHSCQLLVGLKSQKSHQTRMKVGFQIKSEEESQ